MKIQYFSDIHLERVDYQMVHTDADVVVIAGDLHVGTKGIDWIKNNITDKPVIYVAGNHEFYGSVMPDLKVELKKQCKGTNIFLLQNDSIILDGVNFIGATLWTNFNLYKNQPLAMFLANQIMNDYTRIQRHKGVQITANYILAEHTESITFICGAIDRNIPNVIVTHHLPTEMAVAKGFEGHSYNPYYASEFSDFILNNRSIKLWIHGHTHNNNQLMAGECKVCVNARGYVDLGQNTNFDPAKVIAI